MESSSAAQSKALVVPETPVTTAQELAEYDPNTALVAGSDPLADANRRKQVETDLLRLGVAPDEVRRLMLADAHSVDAAPNVPDVPLRLTAEQTAALKVAPAKNVSLQAYAAELAAQSAAARVRAIEAVSLDLPDFRASTAEELRQAEPLLREASMLRRREKFTEAEAKCRAALALVPKDAAALELLGDLFQGVAHINESLAAYRRAVEADPKRISAERKYADLLARQQDFSGVDALTIPRNPWISVLLSSLCPGAGQMFNGEWVKGGVLLAGVIFCVVGWSLMKPPAIPAAPKANGKRMIARPQPLGTGATAMIILGSIFFLYSVADAHLSAKKMESRR